MKTKKLLMLLVSTCLILALAVSPFMAACAKPAVEPGAAEVAALQKEVAALEKKVTAAEKGKAASEKEVAALEKEIAAAKKEIAKLEAAAPEPAEVFEWEFTAWAPRGTIDCDLIDRNFVDNIEAMAGGRIKIKFHGVGELVEPDEIFAAVKAGVVDVGTSCGYHVGELPINGIEYAFPMGPPLLEHHWILWHDRGLYEFYRDEVYLQHNMWLLPHQILVSVPVMISSKEVTTLADISGMKGRAYGTHATMLEKYGATVVWVPFAELYTALATGVIDGAGCPSISEMYDLKLYEVAKYVVLPMQEPWVAASVMVNLDSWNLLPDDLKAIVTIAAMEGSIKGARVHMLMDEEFVGEMKAKGVTFVQLPPEDVATMYEIADEVLEELATKGPDFAKAIEIVSEYMEFLGIK